MECISTTAPAKQLVDHSLVQLGFVDLVPKLSQRSLYLIDLGFILLLFQASNICFGDELGH